MGFMFAAVLLGVIGYLVRFRQWSWLISGYNTSSKAKKARYDVAALTRGVGNFSFFLAGTQVLAGLGFMAGVEWVPVAAMVVLAVASLIFIVYANTGGRYLRRD
ncbi:DUF3784 domain-containing protein [Tessaracoccus sp. G1721]